MKTNKFIIIFLFMTLNSHTFSQTIEYSTFIGGSKNDGGNSWLRHFSIDEEGIVYFAMCTTSADFPVTDDAYDKTYNGGNNWGQEDLVIAQFNVDQNKLKYSSYFGGSSGPEFAPQVLFRDNKLYMAGNTGSPDFPVSNNAYDKSFNGPDFRHADGYITRFSSNRLDYSTYIGTSGIDAIKFVDLGNDGEMIVAGELKNWEEMPITFAFSNEKLENNPNACLIRFNERDHSILSTTLLGATWSTCTARDKNGNIYIAGNTPSKNFPVTPQAYDTSYNGGTEHFYGDIFITKLSPTGDRIIFSTYLGGSEGESVTDICIDPDNNIIICGQTFSKDFPITSNAFDKSFDGAIEPFIAKLDSNGRYLLSSSFLGGNEKDKNEYIQNMAISRNGAIYLCLRTNTSDFPVTSNAMFPNNRGGVDIILSVLDNTLTKLKYSTYIGGSGNDFGVVELDKHGNPVIVGGTSSADFPVTPGSYDTTYNGGENDIFVMKINMDSSLEKQLTNPSSDYFGLTPPGDTPIVFARGIVSTEAFEHSAPAFTPDGKEIYWSVIRNQHDTIYQDIKCIKWTGYEWTKPQTVTFSGNHYDGGPVISADCKRVYFYRDEPVHPGKNEDKISVWSYTRTDNGWINPVNIGGGFSPSFTRKGTMYYGRQTGIFRMVYNNGKYSKPEYLNNQINMTGYLNWTPFIAPDENWLIFSRHINNGDLFITFHDTLTGVWTKPVNMGDKINTPGQERFPSISPDGKYLFFTRSDGNNQHDIYWVSTKIINDIKKELLNPKVTK